MIYFVDAGLIFASNTKKLLIRVKSIRSSHVVVAIDKREKGWKPERGRGRKTNIGFHCSTLADVSDKKDPKSMLNFRYMNLKRLGELRQYAKKNHLVLEEHEQTWYDLTHRADPMTGWMPLASWNVSKKKKSLQP